MSDTELIEPQIEQAIPQASDVQEVPHAEASVINEFEATAQAKGWKPKDQWTGDPDDWSPAKKWLEKGDLLDTIHGLKQQVKATKESVAYLAEHNRKIEEDTHKRALQETENRLKQAVEIGDVVGAKAATQDIVDIHKRQAVPPPPSTEHPAVKAFYIRNASWFNEDTAENAAMTTYAKRRDAEIYAQNPGISPEDEMRQVEKDIQNKFPERFGRPAPIGAHAVSAPAAMVTRPSKTTLDSLPDHHRIVLKRLVQDIKGYDVDRHIQRLKERGEIK